ncbi:uncharacterized protein [Amphiura filiformis]|uniref:uncharacterized protein n=1 Tax=Amphiura filiformis TaxID=82378 RepID=UPI003B21B50B
MKRQYSLRSPAVKRLMKEAQELSEPTEQYYAQPLEDNLFEWHFTVRGPPDSDFESGMYHGRITLPPEYPMKPPSIMLLTPTGRFEVGTKICLSISGHHPETWQPSWSIRTVLLAIIGFMPTKGEGAIGSLDYTTQERKVLAKRSQEWKCKQCDVPNKSILPKETSKAQSEETQREAAEIAAQISFKKEEPKSASQPDATGQEQGAAAAAGTAGAVPPGNVPPPNPYAAFNPAAMGMAFQGQMFPFPPNMMNPMGFNPNAPGVNNQQQLQSQTPSSQSASGTTTNSQSPTSSTTDNQSPTSATGSSTNQQAASAAQPEGAGQQSTPPTSGGTELRHRSSAARGGESGQGNARTDPPLIRRAPGRENQQLPPPAPQSSITGPLLAMAIITIIIAFLLVRRLYRTMEYKFDFDM